MSRLFLSQETLDVWLMQMRVHVERDEMIIDGQRYKLLPAVRFINVERGADEHELVGRVKTERQLEGLGAEHYMQTVKINGVQYSVQEGFVGQIASSTTTHARGATKR